MLTTFRQGRFGNDVSGALFLYPEIYIEIK